MLSLISKHIDSHRAMPSNGPCESTVIFIVGDAGTGKTMLQDALRYMPNIRPVFMGSTNVSGMELKKVFTEHQLFINDHTVYSTTFQFLGRITPKIWGECLKRLYECAPAAVRTASYTKPVDFYEAIWPSLRKVCLQLFYRQQKERTECLSVPEYQKFRRVVVETVPEVAKKGVRRVHAETMERIIAVYPRSRIPDQLLYDTYVHDEAGRLTCSWFLINLGMYYAIHEIYNTGIDKPTEVIVGSCTQQKSINNDCLEGCTDSCSHEPLKINEYSMITMLSLPCILYKEGVFVKNNKFMRRTKSGGPERSANLAIFRNCLETSEPIPKDIVRYLRTKMSVTREQFLAKKCIHLCVTHEECKKVLNADNIAPQDVVLMEETMTASGVNWPDTLYGCTDQAGAMFKSANYVNLIWVRKTVSTPYSIMAKYTFGLLPENNNKEKPKHYSFSEWSNVRKMYKDRPYKTTHTARCVLRGITGSWKGFLKDLADMEEAMEDNLELVSELVTAMACSLIYANVGDEETITKIQEKTSSKAAGVEELLQILHDFRCLMTANANNNKNNDILYTCSVDNLAKLTVTKGTHVYFLNKEGNSPRSNCRVRVGNTMTVTMYKVCTRIDQPVGQYQSFKTTYVKKKGTKRKANGDSVKDTDDIDDVPNDFSDDDDDEEDKIKDNNVLMREAALLSSNDPLEDNKTSDFTVLDIVPLKLSLVSTVAASQGSTINGTVYGEVRKEMTASDLIVMCTRSSCADDLSLYFADTEGVADVDPEKSLCIEPLDQCIQDTIKIITVRSLRDTGVL